MGDQPMHCRQLTSDIEDFSKNQRAVLEMKTSISERKTQEMGLTAGREEEETVNADQQVKMIPAE